jgi:hypothetical protein
MNFEKGNDKLLMSKKPYQKPLFQEQKEMIFMFEGIRKANSTISCRQCSSCHGCR